MNKTVAETMYANIQKVGMPKWSDADQAFAKLVQRNMKVREQGLPTRSGRSAARRRPEDNRGGGSDDIGDVSWSVPTVTLRYAANIPGMTGHHWSSAIAEATPVAHKGVTAGAKVEAMTALDLLMKPELVQQAWEYFRTVQGKQATYQPFPGDADKPAIWLNEKLMQQLRPEMKKFYFDPTKYKTYLEQLGIAVSAAGGREVGPGVSRARPRAGDDHARHRSGRNPARRVRRRRPRRRTLAEQELINSLGWLVTMRWLAGVGVLAAAFVAAHAARGCRSPKRRSTASACSSSSTTPRSVWWLGRLERSGQDSMEAYARFARAQIGLDWLAMTVLTALSGGIESPVIIFFLFHITIAALLLPHPAASCTSRSRRRWSTLVAAARVRRRHPARGAVRPVPPHAARLRRQRPRSSSRRRAT